MKKAQDKISNAHAQHRADESMTLMSKNKFIIPVGGQYSDSKLQQLLYAAAATHLMIYVCEKNV